MAYPTGLTRLTARNIRVGGVPDSTKGAQPVFPGRVPSNWYPVNLPSASNGTPQNADCRTLLNTLAPLVADLTVQMSVFLALSYRQVQTVAPGGTFSLNGATKTAYSALDQSGSAYQCYESVPVDVVNKNPSLGYDLAVRLAAQAAYRIDKDLANLYGQFNTNSVVGTAGSGAVSSANLTAAAADLAGTGEPIFLVVNPTTTTSIAAAQFVSDYPAMPGTGFVLALSALGATPVRVFGSPAVSVTAGGTTTTNNLMFTPSAMAYVTADLGTLLGATSGNWPSALTSVVPQVATSVSKDPETGNPQLVMQLAIGNSGSGNQNVYVNWLRGPLIINNAHGVQVET